MTQYNLILEILITIVLLGIIYPIAYRFRNKKYPLGHPYRNFFIPGLSLKILGAVLISCIYLFYYKGGDTLNFFHEGQIVNTAADDSIGKWLNLLLGIPEENAVGYYKYTRYLLWYNAKSNYIVVSLSAFISMFLAKTFIPTAICFAIISFTGIWAMFRAFVKIYPQYIRQVAVCALFIPSVAIWGSGIFKDTICLFGLGWMTYGTFEILIKKNFSLKTIALTILSFLLVSTVKIYILIAFCPAIVLWILFSYTQNIKSRFSRIILKSGGMLVVAIGFFALLTLLGDEQLGRYSFDNLTQTSKTTREYILRRSEDSEGAAYDLGAITSISDIVLKAPLAINVTLFRPYLWESKKMITLFAALESFLFLLITLIVIFRTGLRKIASTISADPNIQFCLVFSLIFAFAVGISTYNFGALSRYKIPCLPFYLFAIVLIYYKNAPKGSYLLKPLNI
ncbi:hypothetical protein [Niabella terrae]